jgi:hypothetical protein
MSASYLTFLTIQRKKIPVKPNKRMSISRNLFRFHSNFKCLCSLRGVGVEVGSHWFVFVSFVCFSFIFFSFFFSLFFFFFFFFLFNFIYIFFFFLFFFFFFFFFCVCVCFLLGVFFLFLVEGYTYLLNLE